MRFDGGISYREIVEMGEVIPRALTHGLHYTDVMQTLERIGDSDETWCLEWCRSAEVHEEQGRAALEKGRQLTAGQALFRASVCYHFAQFLHFRDVREKLEAASKMVACYRAAMRYFVPPAEAVDVPFEGITLAGYLRLPPGRAKSPCMIFINGTDSTKQEFHNLEAQFLLRGVATLSFDGPGQGETWPKMKLRSDYEKATAAVADFLCRHSAIDPGRLGALGMSFGGHLAVRSAAYDDRLKACISLGGFFETSYYDWKEPLRRIRFMYICGTEDIEQAKRVAAQFDLSGRLGKARSALLVVHGRADRVTPYQQAERIYAEWAGPKELAMFDEGNHCCHNIAYRTHPLMADWAAEMLGA